MNVRISDISASHFRAVWEKGKSKVFSMEEVEVEDVSREIERYDRERYGTGSEREGSVKG